MSSRPSPSPKKLGRLCCDCFESCLLFVMSDFEAAHPFADGPGEIGGW